MHHPDRQASQSDKDDAHRIFAAIGNAYEILSDEGRRREHDEGVRQQRRRARQGGGGMGSGSGCDPRGRHGFGYPAGHDPFAAFDHPFFSSSSSRSDFHFTDPFRLFEQFFAEEAGNRHGLGGGGRRRQGRDAQSSRTTPSADATFFSPFSSSSVDHPFSDPFFSSGGMMGGGGGSPFGMMSAHFDGMNAMMSRMHHGMLMMGGGQSMMGGGNNATSNVGGRVSSSFGSSSASIRGGGSVSTSTRTTVINGVRKTVTERTVVHPDGRVERHVETTGDDGHDYLGGRLPSTSSDQHRALEYNGGGGSRRRHW
ncbi:hypothetical protein ACHAW5_010562 [Stephanodiscus triporus]|uniref:J domain-containing protein n=1 Tax=Stephanodiscus triporus TaxID=2934178 RepID=A0ABD3PM44_9STRA